MLTKEQNERLTKVGAGTPCGELLRRYWQPLCPAGELTEARPRKRIRILGEDVIVIRRSNGDFACIEEFCKHRRASLYYGFVDDDGIRCCYHGWKYDFAGQCVEQPFESAESRHRANVRIKSYPVKRLAGLLFVYMGPDPANAPLLPRWDVCVREDGNRIIQVFPVHRCNWLQIQENTADSVHTYYLHGYMNEVHGLKLEGADYYLRPIEKCEWKLCEWGVDKTIIYGGDHPEVEIRPPLIFPNVLRIPQGPVQAMHWRVPIDDTNTRIIWMGFIPEAKGGKPMPESAETPFKYLPDPIKPDGEYDLTNFYFQDQMVMEAQGAIYDRSLETLGSSDRGIVMYRRLLDAQIALVEQGKEPTVAVVRDPEKNVMIEFAEVTDPGGSLKLSFADARA